jgi:hypothetical protein
MATLADVNLGAGGLVLRGSLGIDEESAAPIASLEARPPVSTAREVGDGVALRSSGSAFEATAAARAPAGGSSTRFGASQASPADRLGEAARGQRRTTSRAFGPSGMQPAAFEARARGGSAQAVAGRSMAPPRFDIPTWDVILDGSRSWAPGGDCVRFAWDLGEGQSLLTSGPNR